MSSNIRIEKTCEVCGNKYIAKKTVTRSCSITCARLLYMRTKRNEKIEEAIKKETQVKRMAMQFTALHKFENAEAATTLVCTDEDFTTALRLAEIYLQHSLLMFNNLPKQSEASQFKTGNSKRKFFDALPQEFTQQQAVETGKLFTLAAHTVNVILHNATNRALP